MADLTNMEGLRSLVRDEDVMAMGFEPGDKYATEVQAVGITALDASYLGWRASGARHAAIVILTQPELADFWIHLDADVLDAVIMPAVESPEPGRLTFDELVQLLRELLSSPFAACLEITVVDLTSIRMRSAIGAKACRCTRRCLRLAFSRHSGPVVVSAAPTPRRRLRHFRIRIRALGIEENSERLGDPLMSRASAPCYYKFLHTANGDETGRRAASLPASQRQRCPKGSVAARPQ